jgi:ligand-binding sensor domain-containing protein/signal transduction histidine kinase
VSAHGVRYLICRVIVAIAVFGVLFTPQFTLPVYGQTGTLRFENISTEQGLSQSTVTAILQDRQGFMWFGTEGGLNKYDGYQFSVYKHDLDDPQSLSDNVITSMYEDRDGTLWIGTSAGLDRLDRRTGIFVHYQQELTGSDSLSGKFVLVIFQDHAGTLWVGTDGGGLNALDLRTNQFTVYKHSPDDPRSLSDNTIRSVYEDRDRVLWIGTGLGLDRFDPITGTFAHDRLDSSGLRTISDVPVYAIDEDSQGALWVGTQEGLFQWNRAEGQLIEYRHDPNAPDSISDDSIRCIFKDSQGTLWIGTRSGLDQFDNTQKRFIHYMHSPNDSHSLISDSIRSIYEDRSGVLWIGTAGGGLSKYARATRKFTLYKYSPGLSNSLSDNNVWSIYEDHNGMLWVGTFSAGLNRFDRRSGMVTVYQHNPEEPGSLSSNEIRTIFEDRNGALWVGTERGGLDRFNPKKETFLHYQHDPADPGSLSDDGVFSIYEDHLGRLWIGTQGGGLNQLDQATGIFTHYQHDANDPLSLSDNDIKAIYEDRTGLLWIGTLGGINLWDDHDHFTVYQHDPKNSSSLSSDLVACIMEDQGGTVWIGTFGGGLNRFNRATQSFTHYIEKNGLPDDTVYGILVGSDGALWLSTNKGLSKFEPGGETFRNYDISDGLQGNQFNPGAFFQSRNGEMFFGGTQGLNAFFPEQVADNPIPPLLVITAFKKFNQTVQTDLASNETIQLSYHDSFISFEFAALDYNAPEKNQYAYKLDGVDKDWVNAGTRRYASYTNLRGGDYTFQVKGSNNDGVWNLEGTVLRIHITPPFWETWWFIGIAGLVVALGVFSGYRLRVRSVEARNRELANRVEQRTHELAALNTIAAVVSHSLDLKEIMSAALDKTIEVTGMEMGVAYRLEEGEAEAAQDNRTLNSIASRGVPESLLQHISRVPFRGTMTKRGAMIGQLIVWRISEYPTPDLREALQSEGMQLGISVPLQVKENIVGAIFLATRTLRQVKPEELDLLDAISRQVGMAVENARLYEQAEQTAAVTERGRLARELHDSVTQLLYSVTLYAEAAAELLTSGETETAARHLRELRDTAQEALREMRLLIFELHQPAFEKSGLAAALQARLDAVEARGGIHSELQVEGVEQLSRPVQAELYNIAREALNNALKHAHAHLVRIRLQFEEAVTELEVCDDGMGFEPAPDRLGGGFGITGMKERAQKIGGILQIESAPGKGTKVIVRVPAKSSGRPNQLELGPTWGETEG